MTGTSLTNYDAEWAAYAQQFATQVPVTAGGKSLSIKGGVFSQGDQQLGTMLCAIILDSVALNKYYEGDYVDGAKAVPKCYAYGFPPEEMRPHVESMQQHMDVFYPQTLNPATGEVGPCSKCKWNEFGTASRGAGKACKNVDRLALIPAGMFVQQRGGFGYDLKLFTDPQHFATIELNKMDLPVTSVKNYREYSNRIIQETGRPPWGVITVIELAPHPKFQTEVKFHLQELIPSDLFPVMRDRYVNTHAGMIEPFSPPRDEAPAAAAHAQPAATPRPAFVPQTAQGLRR